MWMLAVCLTAFQGRSQRIQPEGVFLEDSVAIGQEIAYALSVRYPVSLNVLFPDSTYDFQPFELSRRTYFQTVSDTTQSFDSAVYYLSTFEIDSVQRLQLPVFVVDAVDSTAIFTAPDSVFLRQMIKQLPQKPELKSDTTFQALGRSFNVPMAGLILGVIIAVALLVMLVFGKRIIVWWRIRRIMKRHKRFARRFFNLIRNVSSNNPSTTPEQVLAVWKQYMERLEDAPVSKLTTREISDLYQEKDLKANLQSIDRIVYAGVREKDLFPVFDYLLHFAVERYHQKVRRLRNG